MSNFNFHYVTTPTGEISGQSVLTQTEDAINSIGEVAQKAEDKSASAVATATEALATANSAQSAANNAVAEAEGAVEKAETMTKIVQTYDARITSAEATATAAAQSAQASAADAAQSAINVKSATEAAQTAEKNVLTAVTTAQTAQSTATQAVASAQEAQAEAAMAKTAAETAKSDAQAAQTAAANSAGIAATAIESAYALRVTTKTLTSGDTIATSELTPEGNIKSGDFVLDATASLFKIDKIEDDTATVTASATPFVLAVSYAVSQSLTDAQKTLARANIDAISATGSRGALAGYESTSSATAVSATSGDALTGSNVSIGNGDSGTAWTKIVGLSANSTVTLGSAWKWSGGEVPELSSAGILVCCWASTIGICNFVSGS